MSANTGIEWTDATWNPVEGCSMAKGSEKGGCLNCYAARTALRRPESGLAVMRDSGPRWTGKVGLVEKRLEIPLHWRAPRRIFVNSMSDLFHESLPDEAIDRIFAVMANCKQHTFQVLTKRPERMVRWASRDVMGVRLQTAWGLIRGTGWGNGSARPWPLPTVWLGVSVEDQPTADARIPLLLQTPAAKRFISYEPALGALDIRRWLTSQDECIYVAGKPTRGLDWGICGGESGLGARPMHPDWARSIRDQCVAAGVPFFFKQNGEYASVSEVAGPGAHHHFPDGVTVRRVGKKKAGALLDGREWRQFPT